MTGATAAGVPARQLSCASYLKHVAPHGAVVGRVTDVSWDPGLGAAPRAHGIAVREETVSPVLADDLAR